MNILKRSINENAIKVNNNIEEFLNAGVRSFDQILGALGLGGRKADYDDVNYEFVGGANDELRKKHYDKSLRLLWKAEKHASWSSFNDCTKEEKELMQMADQALNKEERAELKRLQTEDYKKLLNKEYTIGQKKAIVHILALIGHGEAYAWLVSNEVLRDVKSTGAKAALTMQVVEEAKHFVVLRELIRAFDVEVPRLPVWEYLVLEKTLKSNGLEKFFGMNVLIESIALSIFGAMSVYPGLEILKLFHLDESRHTALPSNYFATRPMNAWEKLNPIAMAKRLDLFLPAIPLAMLVEPYFAELGIDVFEFLGSIARKVIHLSYRVGFYLPIPAETLKKVLNFVFNNYCRLTRLNHAWVDFLSAETTIGEEQLAIEKDAFQG